MKTVFHSANTRGHADYGWLNTYHTFSFANYHDSKRTNFGALRVLNDDTVQPGMGFGTHPHRDMEIITIPLDGDLEHKDSTGVTGVIRKGEIQVMSAGTGVTHSEYNHNQDKIVSFLQIWVFPREINLEPRAEQANIEEWMTKNEYHQIISPNHTDSGLWINQDAWFSLGNFDKDFSKKYQIKKEGNGVYIFVISGAVEVASYQLNARDGLGVWDTKEIEIKANQDSEILVMEVPMELPSYLRK